MAQQREQFVPLYEQVASVLRAHVLSLGASAPVHLATERDMCRIYHASRSSIRQALERLESEGLIRRTPGRGTTTEPLGIRAWLRLRQSKLITVITPTHTRIEIPASFYGRIYQGIARRCQEAGIAVSIGQMVGTFPLVGPIYKPENPAQVTGVIVLGVRDERVIAMHVASDYPVVCIDYWTKNLQADVVVADCFAEGLTAADFLLSQGHRSFFYLGNHHYHTGGNQHEADSDLLLAGFQRGLRLAGAPLPVGHIRHCHVAEPADIQAAVQWFAGLKPRPSAGLIFSVPGINFFRAGLSEHGLACPQDVSLIAKAHTGQSFDDATVLMVDPAAMGSAAVEMVVERASEKRTGPIVYAVRPHLQRGKTVRCLPVELI